MFSPPLPLVTVHNNVLQIADGILNESFIKDPSRLQATKKLTAWFNKENKVRYLEHKL